jgi:diguanylate cyclase (GGDEF)-like protein
MVRDHSGTSEIMKSLSAKVLQKLIAGTAEPLLVARIDSADWPVVLSNSAFDTVAGGDQSVGQPLADVIEGMLGRELAVEVSETVRSRQESTLPVEFRSREYLLSLTPLSDEKGDSEQFYAVYWRTTSGFEAAVGDREAHQALLKAKRHIRDLSRDDPVTGLLNTTAFHEVLAHDWAVASREKTTLALVAFSFENFDEYLHVFGRHATDSCLRRVAQAIRRCLRRASDVAAFIDGNGSDKLVVLSHASDEANVREFAERIEHAVRELRLHHPRSSLSKYVAVSSDIAMMQAGEGGTDAVDFLSRVI